MISKSVGERFSHFFSGLKRILPYYITNIAFHGAFGFFLKRLVYLGKLEKIERFNFIDSDYIHIFLFFFVFGIILPVMEEFSFRGILTNNEKQLRIGITLFFPVFVFKIFELIFDINIWIDLFLTLLIGRILYLKTKSISFSINLFYENKILFLIISSIIFALFHTGLNYEFSYNIFLLISIIPFFFSGLIFGLVTLKYGLTYSIVLHMLINFTALFLNLSSN